MATQKLPRRDIDHPFVTRLEVIFLVVLVVLAGMLAFLLFRDLSGAGAGGELPTQAVVAGLPSATPTGTPLPAVATPVVSTPILISSITLTAVSPTPACVYDIRFVRDVTVPDDTVFLPGAGFVKTWRIQNSGTCAWEAGTSWIFVDGHPMSGPHAASVPVTAPGETADVSVSLMAPAQIGRHTGYWALRAPTGQVVDKRYYVRVVVAAPTATATTTPTRPPATATPVIVNWRGEYFNNIGLVGNPVLVRDDTAVAFNWGTGSPGTAVTADNFSARWTRSVYLDGDTYRFYAAADEYTASHQYAPAQRHADSYTGADLAYGHAPTQSDPHRYHYAYAH